MKFFPQGLKPDFIQDLSGTAEAVPYPKPLRSEICAYGMPEGIP
jgi:hypothetical protein